MTSDYEFVGLDERLAREWKHGRSHSAVSASHLMGFLAGVAAACPDLEDESRFLLILFSYRAEIEANEYAAGAA